MINIEENYLKSLRMIKTLNIKNKKEYNKLQEDYLLLSIVSLKYMSKTNNFKEIIKQAEEVE